MAPTDTQLTAKKQNGQKIKRKELHRQIEWLQAENRQLQAELRCYTSSSQGNGDVPSIGIPRPRGCAGDGFNLREEMGLQGQPRLYRAIQRCVRAMVGRAGLDWRIPWRSQPKEEIVKIFRVARKRQPYLRRFTNDWATEEFAKQYLKNHRAYCRRKRYDLDEDGFSSTRPDEVQELTEEFDLQHIDSLELEDEDRNDPNGTSAAGSSRMGGGGDEEEMETE
ncbi:hypothetical protein BN946_scf184761.g3 [Trametes cinnabarina]|uniref:Uncharacterized protein n=1 Tax=Pycnoporus cinnabarinus TaxID=5643 RepID=A0A060S8T8_PYCCI|nr:hypothetical protein BN946_scf184761.g3 [Trametes cinnabarina]